MNNDNLNNSFNENELLNDVSIDPTLPTVPVGGTMNRENRITKTVLSSR